VASPPVPDYTKDMSIHAFVHTDLVNFSIYSVERALPSVLDGLKTSQRKILYTVLKRGYTSLAKEIKVRGRKAPLDPRAVADASRRWRSWLATCRTSRRTCTARRACAAPS
jgi:hypothetical protein